VAWVVTILLLSFPDLMLPVAIGDWIVAAGLMVVAQLGFTRDSASRARSILVTSAVTCAAVGMIATSALAMSGSRRPQVLAESKSVSAATIVTTQTAVPGGRYFAATITEVDGESVSVPVLVFGAAPASRVEIGTALQIDGSLTATTPSDEVSFLVFARGPGRLVAQPPWYLGWANGLRSGFARASGSLPGDGGELLPGLAIGDTSAVSPQLNSAMKASSLTHLTAVSGANCAVVIGLILLVGRAVGLSRGLRVAAALVVLVGFVVLVTPQPSVLRSAIMAALVLGTLASGRPVNGLPVVGVTVLVLLAIDPWLAVDYGFALSVLATAGLMALTSPIARRLEIFLPHWLSLLVAVPVAAQLACQPVLVLLNPSLPLYGVLANALAEPASPIATVVGLLACVALPLFPALGSLLAAIAWVPAAWIASVAVFFAGLPGARLPWPGGFLGATGFTAVTAGILLVIVARVSRRWRVGVGLAAIALVGVMMTCAAVVPGIGVAPAA
jgi:competence protein ComEC